MYCLFALSGFIYYVLDSEYVVHCGLAFLAASLVRRHSYLGLDSVVYYSFKEFSHVAAKGYASLIAAFSLCTFSFVDSDYFSFSPLFWYLFCCVDFIESMSECVSVFFYSY